METVNAVPRYEVLSATWVVRCSSSQRSSVSGMQIRPRACRAMKLMISGVILFGRAHEIAFIFAIFVVDDDDHAAVADVGNGLVNGRNRHRKVMLT